MRSKHILFCTVAGLTSATVHASEDFFPPLKAFTDAPYEVINLGSQPKYDTSNGLFPRLAPSEVIAFYIDYQSNVQAITCDAISQNVRTPEITREIQGTITNTGKESFVGSVAINSTHIDSGAHSAVSQLATESYSQEAGTSSSTSSVSMDNQQVKDDTSSQQSQVDIAETESLTGGLNDTSLQTTVSETVNVSGFRSSQQKASTHDVFSISKTLLGYFEDFFQNAIDESDNAIMVDEEGNAVDQILDGDELALVDEAKGVWLERASRFSYEDSLLTYLTDFPTDEFRKDITLPENPENSSDISCSYKVPNDLDGIQYGHHAGIRFELKNTGNIPLTDLLIAMSPSDNTTYLAAQERKADITSYIPSSEVVLHRRFMPIPAGNTYRTQLFVMADKWELPKPPEEEKGFFDFF